jgi:hypothetical protein
MRQRLGFVLLALLLVSPTALRAQSVEECTVGVASGRATADGRPLLWKNRDTGMKYSNNRVLRLEGKQFEFLGLVVGEKTTWAGVNTEGFAIINAQSADLSGPENDGPGNGTFLRRALGECASVADFQALLESTDREGRMTHTSYGVIDAKGGASIFETTHYSFVHYDAHDPETAPEGWIVRTNFALTGDGKSGGGEERSCRANVLWDRAASEGKLDHRTILRTFARDLSDPYGNPFTLPWKQSDPTLPPFALETYSTINRSTTAASNVFHGVKEDEDPGFTTMWTIIGEPIFSIAAPAWPAAGDAPDPLSRLEESPIRKLSLELKKKSYSTLFRNGKKRRYLDTRDLLRVLRGLYSVEDGILERTEEFLEEIRSRPLEEELLADFQQEMAEKALAGVRETVESALARRPLRVGIIGEGEIVERVRAALAIDSGIDGLVLTPEDLACGALGGMEALILAGEKVAPSLGRTDRTEIRSFLEKGGGVLLLGEVDALLEIEMMETLVTTRRKGWSPARSLLRGAGKELFPELGGHEFLLRSPGPPLANRADIRLGSLGEGRLLRCCLRPDATPGLRWMVPRMTRWTARAALPSYPERFVAPENSEQSERWTRSREEQLLKQLEVAEPENRGKALDTLFEIGLPRACHLAEIALRDDDADLRARAAQHLVDEAFVPALTALRAAVLAEEEKDCKKALGKAVTELEALAGDPPAPLPETELFIDELPLEPGTSRLVAGTDPRLRPAARCVRLFRVEVPEGTERLTVGIHPTGGRRNLDLFLRQGDHAIPDEAGTLAAKNSESAMETITADNPAAGTWWAGVLCSVPLSSTTEEWGATALPGPFHGIDFAITAFTPALGHRETTPGFYKDLFMDSGVRLTTRRELPSADHLGLTMEYMALAENDEANRARQQQLLIGDDTDSNGVLLYPDGAPRFRCIYVNGGSATNHGASLGEEAREQVRAFVRAGGSYTGSCAGAFLSSQAFDDKPEKEEYLRLWPGCTAKTNLVKSGTDLVVPPDSPLLRFSDFGGDGWIENVRHNGGCFTDPTSSRYWATDTEVLALYDYAPDPAFDGEPACWAWKGDDSIGRMVLIGSHPESHTFGEQLELMQAILGYAIEGIGVPEVKAVLRRGVRRMDDNDEPGHERIGDRQIHLFAVDVPEGTEELRVEVCSLREDRPLKVFFHGEEPGCELEEEAIMPTTPAMAECGITIGNPGPGRWYVGIENPTTVEVEKRDWGWEYTGNLDVLDGTAYTIEVILHAGE